MWGQAHHREPPKTCQRPPALHPLASNPTFVSLCKTCFMHFNLHYLKLAEQYLIKIWSIKETHNCKRK